MTEEEYIEPAGDIEVADEVIVDVPVEVVEEEEHEPAAEVEPEQVVVQEPTPVTHNASQAVSGDDVDNVILANCIYKNVYARKSLTVHHLQRRLIELGYKDADADKDGWLGDETVASIKKFQADKGMDVTGTVDADTFTKIFEGDVHVNVVL